MFAVSVVICRSFFWSWGLFVIMATSSTQDRQVDVLCILLFRLLFFSICLFISSISVAYCVTASTPPCLMLLVICMGLVCPSDVLIFAVRFSLRLSVRFHIAPVQPCLFMVYIIASSHALS